ncbi:hypothetical protein [Sporisorium scitamineum]|uniref:Uncharacterized protein n=1 Tax=Sporisorium scitamineum TaxID=49012 RepID=A0A0F7SD07_9BASI|nr:hypothetical protein [Sporisorium scitamineum]
MSAPSSAPNGLEPEPPLPRPSVVAGSRSSSRASSSGKSVNASGHASRSASPAQPQQSVPRNRTTGPFRPSQLRESRSVSRDATAASSSARRASGSGVRAHAHLATDASELIVLSSDSSSDEEDNEDDVPDMRWEREPVIRPPPTDFFEVSGVRRAQPTAPTHRASSTSVKERPSHHRPTTEVLQFGDASQVAASL